MAQAKKQIKHSQESEIISLLQDVINNPQNPLHNDPKKLQYAKDYLKDHTKWTTGLGICVETENEVPLSDLINNPFLRRCPSITKAVQNGQYSVTVNGSSGVVPRHGTRTPR